MSSWISTKPNKGIKRKATKEAKVEEYPPLPLDWTRLSRSQGGCLRQNDTNSGLQPCVCCPTRRSTRRDNGLSTPLDNNDNESSRIVLRGSVMFCLHEPNPPWFQGYFVPSKELPPSSTNDNDTSVTKDLTAEWDESSFFGVPTTSSSRRNVWGLLAMQQEVDDCLQCAEGGYRVVDLRLKRPPTYLNNKNKNRSVTLADVEWRGADWMNLSHPYIRMQTRKFVTGTKAAHLLRTVFRGLWQNAAGDGGNLGDGGGPNEVLELFPHVAIVIGDMEMSVPAETPPAATMDEKHDP